MTYIKIKLQIVITTRHAVNKLAIIYSLFMVTSLQATEFSANLINDTGSIISGGINKKSAIRTYASVGVEFTLGKNYTFYVDGALLRGNNGNLDTGDIQAYSNIDGNEFSKIYEYWLEGHYEKQGIRFKLGQIDVNSEFAFIDHGSEFINSSMGFSPTITFLPTYPVPTLGSFFTVKLGENSTASLGVFSDDSNRFDKKFYIGEWLGANSSFIVKIGMWHQSGGIELLGSSNIKDDTGGIYATAEGELDMQILSSQSAGWYSQIGYSDDKIASIYSHGGIGVTFYGVFNRENDIAGFGISHASTSRYLHNELQNAETALELFYLYSLNDHLSFKPDIQYIVTPATDKNVGNALIFTLRTEVSF